MTPQAPIKRDPDFFERRIKTQSAKRGKSGALYRQKDVEELFNKYIDASKQKPQAKQIYAGMHPTNGQYNAILRGKDNLGFISFQ